VRERVCQAEKPRASEISFASMPSMIADRFNARPQDNHHLFDALEVSCERTYTHCHCKVEVCTCVFFSARRYDKCLAAGMKPGLVLNDDQKRVRFRKMIEKKGSMAFGTGPTSTVVSPAAAGRGRKRLADGEDGLGRSRRISETVLGDEDEDEDDDDDDRSMSIPTSFQRQQSR